MARRKKNHQQAEGNERWLVSYADFITLLFAFFTVLYATSEQNVEKAKKFELSIKQHLIKFGSLGQSGNEVDKGERYNNLIEPPIKSFPRGNKDIIKLLTKVETFIEKNISDEELEKKITDITGEAIGVRISLDENELFPRGSTKFKRTAVPLLNKMASLLKQTQKRIIVEGHTSDSALNRELLPTSWELASIRATKVVRYFIKAHGIDPERLGAISYGNNRPVVPNSSGGNSKRNKRIDLLILAYDAPL